ALNSGIALLFARIRADEQFFHRIVIGECSWEAFPCCLVDSSTHPCLGTFLHHSVNSTHPSFAEYLDDLKFSIQHNTYGQWHSSCFLRMPQCSLTSTTTAVTLSSPPLAFAMSINVSQIFCGLAFSLRTFCRS